ncbi:YbjN domain-containing protein [Asticcacaulis sp. YBE204]|uniref:YbjN domain-containing protein n=1 Tax=Asticcacaulis sp. YBE204 TaxID=1282363 RepID=UPI0003C3CCF6|nr:YbjN domain-containing protein [Asticcacaulis sp. YBE204]ESQ78076.1 hypothetical protein AEYBE204_16405 [Asticcacaulis sp. YBE204]
MDLPQADYSDHMSDPLDMVETILGDEGLTFERTPDGEVVFALAGDWKTYDMWFSWRPEGDCLQLCTALDIRFDPPKVPSIYELLSLVNQRVWFGHFEVYQDELLNTDEGQPVADIVFRHTLVSTPVERPGQLQTAHMINSAAEAVDRFYPAFDFMLRGAKSPADAMAACLFETVGEA